MKANEEIGTRIKKIRTNLGLNLEQFGEKIGGASKGLVSNWEHGTNLPNSKRLKLIADLNNTSVEELVYGTNKERIEEAREVLKYIPKMKDIFSEPITKNDIDAINYFSKEQTNILLSEAIKTYDSVIQDDHKDNGLMNELFASYILDRFTTEYRKLVKTNSNLIASVIDDLNKISEEFVSSYNNISDPQVSLKGNLSILSDVYDSSVSNELINQIMNGITNLENELRQLKKDYPDTERPIKIDTYLYGDETAENGVSLLKSSEIDKQSLSLKKDVDNISNFDPNYDEIINIIEQNTLKALSKKILKREN